MHLPPSQGEEDSEETEEGEEEEEDSGRIHEGGIDLGLKLLSSQAQGEDHGGYSHAHGLSHLPHRSQGGRSNTVELPFHGTHHRIGVGGREEGESQSQKGKTEYYLEQRSFSSQEDEGKESEGGEAHSQGGY